MMLDTNFIEMVSNHLRGVLGDDFDAETFWDTLDGETDVMDVIGHLLTKRAELTAHADASKDLANTFRDRASRLEASAKAVTVSLGHILDAAGEKKVTHPLGTVSRTKPRLGLEIFDETAIPSQLCKVVSTPDRTAIKKQLEAGEDVPGAELKEGLPGLTVRTK